nr:hypothetical protein [Mycobacterium pseudoshottsii]
MYSKFRDRRRVPGLRAAAVIHPDSRHPQPQEGRAPALLISRLVSWVDDLWCRAIGAGV